MTETMTHHNPITPNDEQQLIQNAAAIPDAITRALAEYHALLAQIAALEEAGITNASIYMRDGDKMYLIHPTAPDGSRRREYIGNKLARQAAARARVERHAQHQQLTIQANHTANRIREASRTIANALHRLQEIAK